MLCHLSETLFLSSSSGSSWSCMIQLKGALLSEIFSLKCVSFVSHPVFRHPGWRWVPTLFSNPIASHLPSGVAEGLNFVVRGKVHIHILSRLSMKLVTYFLLSGEPSLGVLPHALARGSWTSCSLGPVSETKEPKWVHLGSPTGLGAGRNPLWSSV